MPKQIVVALVAAVTVVAPATASAASHQSVCDKAYTARQQVVKHHGKRAPGRNICRFGVKHSDGHVVKATYGQKKRYLGQLRRLLTPMMVAGAPGQRPAGVQTPHANGTLEAIAACESGGNPRTNTGNGFYGKYQFTLSTWQAVGGSGNPAAASEAEQDMRAAKLYAQAGPGQWPVCGR
jgi:hypothetical protein